MTNAEQGTNGPDLYAVQPLVAGFARHVEHEIATAGRQTPETIHQLRIAITKLRTALLSFPGLLSARQAGALERNLQWLMRRLAAAREWDVLLADARHAWSAKQPSADRRLAIEAIATRRVQALNRVVRALHSARCARLLAELHRLERRRSPSARQRRARNAASIQHMSALVLDARLRQVRKRGQHFRRLDARDLHRLRMSLKRLRYASEMLGRWFPDSDPGAYIESVKQMQIDLGRIQDLIVGKALAVRIGKQLGRAGKAQTKALCRRLRHRPRGRRLRREWKSLVRRKPFWG